MVDEARELVERLQVPVALTWGAADILPETSPYRIGTFGTHGTRAANFAVQNADFILSIGARLDTKATGTPQRNFARGARIVMCDVDPYELGKMARLGLVVQPYCEDAKVSLNRDWPLRPSGEWLARCQDWKRRYPPGPGKAYDVITQLANSCKPNEIIVCDTGCAVAWMMQAFEFKEGQRFIHAFNQTPMGYGLPAAIGAHYAMGKRIVYVAGDGSIMPNLGELATIAGHNLPIKIILFDNKGHAMCRQTQREWLGGIYPSTSIAGGLRFPNWARLALAHGFFVARDMGATLAWDGPAISICEIAEDEDVSPKNKFGKPIEEMYPELSREELEREMVVELVA